MGDGEASRARVLIVDDDPDTRAMTAEALHDLYEVVTAAQGAEALARAGEQRPDAMLIDVMLGTESGWELIRTLRADPRFRGLSIVVLSGERAPQPPPGVGPCDAYLSKPCRMARLREVLTSLVAPGAGRRSP